MEHIIFIIIIITYCILPLSLFRRTTHVHTRLSYYIMRGFRLRVYTNTREKPIYHSIVFVDRFFTTPFRIRRCIPRIYIYMYTCIYWNHEVIAVSVLFYYVNLYVLIIHNLSFFFRDGSVVKCFIF